MTPPTWPTVAICVPTFRRPEGLRKLLTELARLEYPGRLSVFVVENDGERHEGTAVVAAVATYFPFSLTCVTEVRRGQTFAYNTGFVSAASAFPVPDYVAVLDDDEYPEPNWLRELVATAERHRADVVGGPVLPVFDDPTHWLAQSELYIPLPYTSSGPVDMIYGTGGMLIRRDVLTRYFDEPFSHAFAFTGGSDLDFFRRCRCDGCTFAWAAEARVNETIPRQRTTLSFLIKRGFSIGNDRTRVDRAHATGVRNTAIRWARGLGLVLYGVVLLPVAAFRGRLAVVGRLMDVARGAGRIAAEFNVLYEEYR